MTKFLHIGKVKPDKTWHNRYYVHPYHELIVVQNGIMHIDGPGGSFALSANEAALYPAGVYHQEESDPDFPVESFFVVFEDETFQADKILHKSAPDLLLRTMAATLFDLVQTGNSIPFADEYISLMLKLFSFETTSMQKEFVHNANYFMSKNLHLPITLDDIAAAAGKSKFLFIRQYQQETGITPIKKLWQLRCEEAVALLKYTALPIKEIAFRTGFADTGHFSRRIKSFCGKMPSNIRNPIHRKSNFSQ